QQFAHPFGKIGGEWELASGIGRHFRILVIGAGDIDLVFDQRLIAHHFAGKHKGVADDEAFNEIFLDLAENPAAAADHAGVAASAAARAHQLYLQHRLFDDGADIEAIALPHARIGDAPFALLVLLDARKTFI